MKRLLGTLLAPALALTLSLGLASCSGDADQDATPSPSVTQGSGAPTETSEATSAPEPGTVESPRSPVPSDLVYPSESIGPEIDFTEVALLSESAVGGEVAQVPVVLDSTQAVSDFTAQFSGGTMADQVRQAVSGAEVGSDEVLLGTVVALGCETPGGVSVNKQNGVTINPIDMPKSTVQCFAPVTTVAIVTVKTAELG